MPASNLRFLIVEDHDFQRRAFVQLLHSMGAAAVHEAEDGRAALRVLRDPDRPVDVVVSDLSMPGMDGMELVRHLGETGARVSLILASALPADLLLSIANMARAYKVRLLGVIGKPPSARKLVPLIELHKASAPQATAADAAFALSEIADAWTHNEFEPWYLPKVDLTNGRVRGMTSVARWRHPSRGVLEPAAFMPSVTARGLQDDFVWMMLQKAVADGARWTAEGIDLPVTVHLGFASLTETDLAMRVRQLVANESVPASQVILSVSESAIDTGQPRALENFARLRMDGFGLAVDDFGTGTMELEQLALVNFTEIRIPPDYVSGVGRDDSKRAGLAVGLQVAQELKLVAVADGIASRQDWTLLKEWGCVLGQGPFISEALPAEEVPAWIRRWTGGTIR